MINIVKKYWYHNNAEMACEHLVRDATLHWKKEDNVIDDITVIIIFLNITN